MVEGGMTKYPFVTETFLRNLMLVVFKAVEGYEDKNTELTIKEFFHASPQQLNDVLYRTIKYINVELIKDITSTKCRSYLKSLEIILSVAITEANLEQFLNKIDESVSTTKELIDYAKTVSCQENVVKDAYRQVAIRLTYLHVYPALEELSKHLDNEALPLDQFIAGLKERVKSLTVKFEQDISKGAQIDEFSLNNSYDNTVMHRYAMLLADQNCVATPFPTMTKAMRGGFAPTRIYVIGGPSGCGKSTLLLNCALHYLTDTSVFESGKKERFGTVLYITVENLMHETLCRIASWIHGYDILKKYLDHPKAHEKIAKDIDAGIRELKERSVRNLELRYIAPSPTCVVDICTTIDKIAKQYAGTDQPLELIIIDFLNPIASFSGEDTSLLRHKLGELTRIFKNKSIEYEVPVITAAQLNRTSYDSSAPLSVAMMGESMQIVDNADGIILLREIGKSPNSKTLEVRVGKLRYGDDVLFHVDMIRGNYHMKEVKVGMPGGNMQPQMSGSTDPIPRLL